LLGSTLLLIDLYAISFGTENDGHRLTGDQGQKTGGDESQGQGEYINCLQYYKVIVDYM
jgi:hypothetical protein